MNYVDDLPIWAVYALLVLLMLVFAELGFRIGIWMQDRSDTPGEGKVGGAVVAGMLGLMAFLMAFTIGIVIGQQSERRAMVVEEANAIGTAWLRAGLFEEPDLTAIRPLLQEYTEIRIAAADDPSLYDEVSTRSEEIHTEMWAILEGSVQQGYDSDVLGLTIESVNDVIDAHSTRVFVAGLRLPRILGILLFLATLFSFMLVGVASSNDRKRDTAAMIIFALVFAGVMIVIVDLNRPQEGLLTVPQTAMIDLLRSMTP
ncbi:MAG: hypothetical protein ACR2NG_02305 [Acidimicrobiia bacterium]